MTSNIFIAGNRWQSFAADDSQWCANRDVF